MKYLKQLKDLYKNNFNRITRMFEIYIFELEINEQIYHI